MFADWELVVSGVSRLDIAFEPALASLRDAGFLRGAHHVELSYAEDGVHITGTRRGPTEGEVQAALLAMRDGGVFTQPRRVHAAYRRFRKGGRIEVARPVDLLVGGN